MINKTIVISCEHANNNIPDEYKYLFDDAEKVLNTHRGYDLGAGNLFDLLNNTYIVYKQSATASRLLVDINRSLHRRSLFSEFTKSLSKEKKNNLLNKYYYAFRKPFDEKVKSLWKENKTVFHLSVHSFTPELDGKVRETDFGILYDPSRPAEKYFATLWKKELNIILPKMRVRYNYPFRGKPDGHVKHFRLLEKDKYLGIEFEMNQKYAGDKKVMEGIAEAFNRVCEKWVG